MAVFKYTSQNAIISGRLNHTTLQSTRAGQVAQNTAWLVNHRKESQQKQRQRFRYVTAYWRFLTDGQRADWAAAAPPPLSGFLYFMRINIMAAKQGQPIQEVPFPVTYDYFIEPLNFDANFISGPNIYFFNLSVLSDPSPAGQPITGFAWMQVCPSGQCDPKKFEASGPFEPDDDYSGSHPLFQWSESFYSGQPPVQPGSRIYCWFHYYDNSQHKQASNEVLMELDIPV